MTAEQEFKGKTVQKAVEEAAKALGIPDDAVKYDIISHGSTGIFGLAGIKKARIKVKGVERAERSAENKPEDLDAETRDAAKPDDSIETGGLEESQQMAEAILRRMVDAISPESTISIDTKDRELRFHIDLKSERMTIETPDGFIQDELHGLEGLSPLTDENTGLSSLDVEAKLTILRIDGDR
jgi:spoIIIJ-associated protein